MTRPATTERHLRAAVFDMDGVLTDTARLHARAWKELIDGYLESRKARSGIRHEPFDANRDYRTYVDGKPRQEGLRSFLEAREIELPPGDPDDSPDRETVHGLARRKDAIFQRVLEQEGVETIRGTLALVRRLRDKGIRTAVASSSRNCESILERAGIAGLFDTRVDGVTLHQEGLSGKPHPEMFLEAVRRLDVEPAAAAVFEDAVSGVRAGRRGGFGLVVGVAEEADERWELRRSGADLAHPTSTLAHLTLKDLDPWIAAGQGHLPSLPAHWEEFREAVGPRRPALFLDYDGTLTPIVSRPDEARLSEPMRDALAGLARRWPTTVVSGRDREDVEAMVGLDALSYAGSHGFDIHAVQRKGEPLQHRAAEQVEEGVRTVARRLKEELEPVEGALVEPKRFTVAVHYRMVADEDVDRVAAAVDQVVRGHSELRTSHGKRVFEIRPDLEWDKGRAVLWLLDALELDGRDYVPIYLGDDTTDEDAFRALAGRGIGVVIASVPRPSAARYQLQDPGEVGTFLQRLAGPKP